MFLESMGTNIMGEFLALASLSLIAKGSSQTANTCLTFSQDLVAESDTVVPDSHLGISLFCTFWALGVRLWP